MAVITIGANSADDFAGIEDTKLKSDEPTANQDANDLEITKWSAGDHSHSVVRVTGLSNIPAGATIVSATLHLYQKSAVGAGAQTMNARRVLRVWNETQATWQVYTTGNGWTTNGCLSDGADRETSIAATATANDTSSEYKVFSGSGMTQHVQDFVDGIISDLSYHLERDGTGEDTTARVYARSEDTDGIRPFMTVDYTEGGGSNDALIVFRKA